MFKKHVYTYALTYRALALERQGLLIEWDDGSWSEASPLPGFSKETYEEVKRSAKETTYLPSLAFAHDVHKTTSGSLPLAGLLLGTRKEILKHIESLKNLGITCAKLKIQHLSTQDTISLIKEISPHLTLRIDANKSLTLEQALYIAKKTEGCDIAFFEEPLQNPDELISFPYPIALDESLSSHYFLKNLAAIVVKPTLFGNFEACTRWAFLNKPTIFSSSFESGIGLMQIMEYAKKFFAQHPTLQVPLGLGTYLFLEEDLLESPLIIKQGTIEAPRGGLSLVKRFLAAV